MTYTSYIHITNAFVEGLAAYLKKKDIPLDEVVEVFAGNGALGLRLGLKADRNISDSLLYAEDGYEDDVNVHWDRKPPGVVPETAYETVLRFHAKERAKIRLLIMGAPLPALSTYCPSYEAAKALHYLVRRQHALHRGNEQPRLRFAQVFPACGNRRRRPGTIVSKSGIPKL